jgi:hypothetical protein
VVGEELDDRMGDEIVAIAGDHVAGSKPRGRRFDSCARCRFDQSRPFMFGGVAGWRCTSRTHTLAPSKPL